AYRRDDGALTGSGGAALAPAARRRHLPEVDVREPNPGKLPALRLRDRAAGCGRTGIAGPRRVRSRRPQPRCLRPYLVARNCGQIANWRAIAIWPQSRRADRAL